MRNVLLEYMEEGQQHGVSASGPIQACSKFGLKEEMTFWNQFFGLPAPPACPSPAWRGSAVVPCPQGTWHGPEAEVLPYNHLYV